MHTKIKALLTEKDAVSPVIGVILMVAITVILAAVIGTFALGQGDILGENPPNAHLEINVDQTGEVTIAHHGGDNIDAANVEVVGADINPETVPEEIRAGTQVSGVATDSEIRVVWHGESTSSTIATHSITTLVNEYEPPEEHESLEWSDFDADEVEAHYVNLVNDYRANEGLDPVEFDADLENHAETTADEWGAGNDEYHTDPECSDGSLARGSGVFYESEYPPSTFDSNEDVAELIFENTLYAYDDGDGHFPLTAESLDSGTGVTITEDGDHAGLYSQHFVCDGE